MNNIDKKAMQSRVVYSFGVREIINKNTSEDFISMSAIDTSKTRKERQKAMVRGWDEVVNRLAR